MIQGPAFEGYEEVTPVANIHGEKTLIGAMLLDVQACNDAMEILEGSDFYLDSHRKIFGVIIDLLDIGQPVDLTNVLDMLAKRKELDSIGGMAYLVSLTEGIPRKLNVESWVRIIRDKSNLRQTINRCETAMARCADGSESSSAILESLEADLMQIADGMHVRKFETLLDSVKEKGGVDSYIEAMFNPAAMTGLATGYTDFDAMTGGLKESELIVIGARPSVGKSALMMNIGTNVVLADAKAVIAIFSLEMSKTSLHRRMLASVASVSARRAQMGWLSAEEKKKLSSALLALSDKNLMIDDTPGITPMQLRAKCRRLKQQKGQLDLVMIDYLQLMSGGRKVENRQQEVATISRSLKALAKELKVPVVALAQVGRGAEMYGDKRPTMSTLRESAQIEADSDVIALIHREALYHPDDPEVKGLAELLLVKNREGATGTIHLAYIEEITRFENLQRG